MHWGYILGYVIFLIVMAAIAVFLYVYKTYTKNRLFTKPKMPILPIIILCLLLVCFCLIGSYFAWNMNSDDPAKGAKLHVIFSFILMGLCLLYLTAIIVITINNRKNKIDYSNIGKINWNQKINELKSQNNNLEDLKQKLSIKHKKYYYQMLSYYETILNNAKNSKISRADQIADIVTFNDAFSHKWSRKLNNFQLLLTYQYCALFQKKFGQN